MGAGLKPTPHQLEAIARLRGTTDAAKLIEAILDYENALNERLLNANDEVTIRHSQGSIRALRAVREVYDSAPELLRKFQNTRNTQ